MALSSFATAARNKNRRVSASPASLYRPLMSKREAMAFFGVSARTLERMVAAGKICPIRVTPGTLRYRREDLEAYVEACEYARGTFRGA